MDLTTLLKFLHVLCAIVWLGGGLAMILAGVFLGQSPAPARLMAVIAITTLLAPRLFVPGSIATLVTGVLLVLAGGYGWPAWVVLGLGGVAFTAVFGGTVLGPTAERALKAAEAGGDPAGVPQALRLVRYGKFDYVVQFSIVWLMVAKPGWSDTGALALVAVAILAGAALFLRPVPATAA